MYCRIKESDDEQNQNEWEAQQLPHPLLAMEVTDKGIAMLEGYVAAVRDAVGMEIPLSMDHLGHLGVKSIIRLGKAYEKYNLAWMEDVIPWMYTDLLKQISDQSPTPILTGEDIYLKEPFETLCAAHEPHRDASQLELRCPVQAHGLLELELAPRGHAPLELLEHDHRHHACARQQEDADPHGIDLEAL